MPKSQLDEYTYLLRDIGALSRLFSESEKPFIHSRTAEYLFCKIFDAENLSRSDIAIDAMKGSIGTGVKTFVYSGRPTYQKVAEFNRAITEHGSLSGLEKIKNISSMRNDRLRFVETAYGVDTLKYHCILREKNKILVYEEPMHSIDIGAIQIVSDQPSTIKFTDGVNKYSFSNSKSTLLKEFSPGELILQTDVKILEDPFTLVAKFSKDVPETAMYVPPQRIVLPMYSYRHGGPYVFPRSGLNQWNAEGRPRNNDEVYLPIPKTIRDKYGSFLPARDKSFELTLPNKKVLSVKVSQDDGKALMSNPNSALGEWLLRDVLDLGDGEILTYEKLAELGIDSVEISKLGDKYYANFLPLREYEEFINA